MQYVWISNRGDQHWALPSAPVSFRTLSSSSDTTSLLNFDFTVHSLSKHHIFAIFLN